MVSPANPEQTKAKRLAALEIANSRKNRQRPIRDKCNQLRRLYEMQDVMFETVTKGNCEVQDKVRACQAWKELELLRRLILGKPGSISSAMPRDEKRKQASKTSSLPLDNDLEKAA